ncbi:hypothetical protein BDK88_3174 [Natrinema hispanicum]|uniref:Uncharacterized protein n=1 Tax=Natrinema hispanicum TaxID=392421 RepID=A0A482YAH0_9EURY|nr:hypothetical protein BDK88_3174 [Natrinema hispanicum]
MLSDTPQNELYVEYSYLIPFGNNVYFRRVYNRSSATWYWIVSA